MKIKGDTIKKDKPLSSGRLYTVNGSRTITFEEKETDDVVNINFEIKDKQYGIYGNEFKPSFVNDNGGKKADILAFVIDEDEKCFSSWVFDVKKSVGGEDVIFHLVEQLLESIKHKNAVATYLEGFKETQHIGYITRELQCDRIQETIDKKTSYLEKKRADAECVQNLIGTRAKLYLLKEEKKLAVIRAFQNNRITNGNKVYEIESYISKEKNGKFVCDLNVACS